jgi:hypothetical protein
MSSVPSNATLIDAVQTGIQQAATVAEVQTPTGHRVRLPDVGSLLEAQQRLRELANEANGGCMTTHVQVGRAE